MIAPVDLTNIEAALASRAGWIELGVVGGCFAIGWFIDRRLRLKSASGAEVVRLGLGSVNRLLLPLVTLVLMVVAALVFRRWQPPFFLQIAIPLMIALALIRLVVYAMREIFGTPTWLPSISTVAVPSGEITVSTPVWPGWSECCSRNSSMPGSNSSSSGMRVMVKLAPTGTSRSGRASGAR